jgi:hypothetical protein
MGLSSCMARQPALHKRLGTRQGCLDLNRKSVAVLKSMGLEEEQAGCRRCCSMANQKRGEASS